MLFRPTTSYELRAKHVTKLVGLIFTKRAVNRMRITALNVNNYKSLRQTTWYPGQLTVIVGANASGKSNFAEVHDFLSDLYQHGLAVAVARKGGYENIAHRKMRRSRGGISMKVVAELNHLDRRILPAFYRSAYSDDIRFTHSFEFRTKGAAIKSDFEIEYESILLEQKVKNSWRTFAEINRKRQTVKYNFEEIKSSNTNKLKAQFRILDNLDDFVDSDSLSATDLILSIVSRFIPILRIFSQTLSEVRVFQLSPTDTRQFGVPIPNPEMDIHGGNLPAVVDMIIQHHSKVWSKIIDIMRQLLPGLERIDVDYTHSRTLGLYFHEKGVGRPWNVAEVSDGTIHSLAFLVSLFDPRTTFLVIEEPENSVHTWILRTLMEAAIQAAEGKQIVLTTHSRVVVDAIKPADVWVMWRDQGESNLGQLRSLDEDLLDLIEQGDLTTFEILDTGAISEALPPAPKT